MPLENIADVALGEGRHLAFDRLRQIVTNVDGGASERTQHTRMRRQQHGANADIAHDCGAVQRTRTAEHDQREVTRIMTLLDGHQTCASCHLMIDDGKNRFGSLFDAEAQLVAEGIDRHPCIRHVELLQVFHADGAIGIDASEHGVGVSDCGFGAAAGEANGTGHRTRAARTDLQGAAAVQRRDAAATGADRVHVDHRHAQGNTEVQLGGPGNPRGATDHDGDVITGAAHVAGDDIGEARFGGQFCRCHHAGCRT